MKRIIETILLAALMIAAAPASAEESTAARSQLQETVERLGLTDDQKEQVEPVLEQAASKRDRILAKYGINPDNPNNSKKPRLRTMRSVKKEMDALREDTASKLKGILTAEQLSEYEQVQKERQEAMRERMRG